MEDLLLQNKTLQEIADFLNVSISTVSESLTRKQPPINEDCNKYGLGAWQEFKDSITVFGNGYTLKDMDYIKNNDKTYFKHLLTNDYIIKDKIPMTDNLDSLKPSEIDLAINKIKSKLSYNKDYALGIGVEGRNILT